MAYVSDDWMFRDLTDEEEEQFKQWARDNQTAEHYEKREVYHPVIRKEWEKIGFKGGK